MARSAEVIWMVLTESVRRRLAITQQHFLIPSKLESGWFSHWLDQWFPNWGTRLTSRYIVQMGVEGIIWIGVDKVHYGSNYETRAKWKHPVWLTECHFLHLAQSHTCYGGAIHHEQSWLHWNGKPRTVSSVSLFIFTCQQNSNTSLNGQ